MKLTRISLRELCFYYKIMNDNIIKNNIQKEVEMI